MVTPGQPLKRFSGQRRWRLGGPNFEPRLIKLGLAGAGLLLLSASLSLTAGDLKFLVNGLLGIAALSLVVITLWRPAATAPLLLFLLFTRASDLPWLEQSRISVNQGVVALFLVSLLAHRWLARRRLVTRDPAFGALLVYGAAIALSTVAANDRVSTVAALIAYLREVVIVLILFNLISTLPELRRASWTLVAAGLFLSVAALTNLTTGYDFAGMASTETSYIANGEVGLRLAGPLHESNLFAQMLVVVIPFALYCAWAERSRLPRLAGLGATAVIGFCIVLTFSRAGFLALAVVAAAAAVKQRSHPRRILVLVVALLPAAVAAPQPYWARLGTMAEFAQLVVPPVPGALDLSQLAIGGDRAGQPARSAPPRREHGFDSPVASAEPGSAELEIDPSLAARWRQWRVALQMFLAHPLTGVGKDNYYFVYSNYYGRVDRTLENPLGPHNVPIHILAESGLAGLAAYAAIAVVTLWSLRRARLRFARAGLERGALLLEAIEIAMYGYLATAMFANDNIYQRTLWLLIALAIAGRQLSLRLVDPGVAPVSSGVPEARPSTDLMATAGAASIRTPQLPEGG